jgi:hypothetical protein
MPNFIGDGLSVLWARTGARVAQDAPVLKKGETGLQRTL